MSITDTRQRDERTVTTEHRRPYQAPEVIVYGSVAALAMGGSGNSDDSNPNHPHYYN
jgi:hypothetical protein